MPSRINDHVVVVHSAPDCGTPRHKLHSIDAQTAWLPLRALVVVLVGLVYRVLLPRGLVPCAFELLFEVSRSDARHLGCRPLSTEQIDHGGLGIMQQSPQTGKLLRQQILYFLLDSAHN